MKQRLRFHPLLGADFDSPLWRRVGISLIVLALHAAVFFGLLVMRIVDLDMPSPRREPAMTYITLPPMPPPKPARIKGGNKGKGGSIPYFNPYTFGHAGPNAITVMRIRPFVWDGTKGCPTPLRPGSPEWKERCLPNPSVVKTDDGTEDFSLVPRDSPAFKQWEAEIKKRNSPVELPCGYMRKDPPMLGPHENSSAMVDLGCAAHKWFGR